MGTNNAPEAHREYREWQDLLRRIRALEQKPRAIPELDADPDATSAVNLWMLSDGRLRWRDHTGTIYQAQTMTAGSSSSSNPFPADSTQRNYTGIYNAQWSKTYAGNNPITTTDAMFGANNGTSYHSQLGFDATSIAADLSGSEIRRVELYLQIKDSTPPNAVNVSVGTHNNAVSPATWTAVTYRLTEKLYSSPGMQWATISNTIGSALRDGTIQGIVLDPQSTNTGLYGVAAGVGGSGASPQLRITYTK